MVENSDFSRDTFETLDISAVSMVATSTRSDLPLKMSYARTFLNGGDLSWARYAYLENIRAFNGFFEDNPRKTSPRDFLEAFNQLILSLRQDGFRPDLEPVSLSPSGEVLDGAHRVAAAAALGLYVPARIIDFEIDWGFEYFKRRGQPTAVSDFGARTSIEVDHTARLAFVFGSNSPEKTQVFLDDLSKSGSVKYVKSLRLSFTEIVSLKRLLYSDPEHTGWIGSAGNGFAGARRHARESIGKWPVRIIMTSGISNEALVQAKSRLRNFSGTNQASIHTTDTWTESIGLGSLLFSPHVHIVLRNLSPRWELLRERLSGPFLGESLYQKKDFLFVGSVVLDVLGIRTARDLDFLHTNDDSREPTPSQFDNHISESKFYQHSATDVVYDPRKYFSIEGFQFLSPSELAKFKKNRGEFPKDYADRLAMLLRLRLHLSSASFWSGSTIIRGVAQLRKCRIWTKERIDGLYIRVARMGKNG